VTSGVRVRAGYPSVLGNLKNVKQVQLKVLHRPWRREGTTKDLHELKTPSVGVES